MPELTADSKCSRCGGELELSVRACPDLSVVNVLTCLACRVVAVEGDDQVYPVDAFGVYELGVKLQKRHEKVQQAAKEREGRFTEVKSS